MNEFIKAQAPSTVTGFSHMSNRGVNIVPPKKNGGVQRVSILTEISNAEIVAPNNVGCLLPSDFANSLKVF